ncbi:MAG: hypothetical protein KBB37_02405 [Bacteroidia bacterium]|nr:hypothetical protein [Bacteroidia bacterium]MBP7260112.1 hypothetical protein [Bacteroidia bacterium]MBP9179499.1 hypothetical protein [Bacteroidia bacterium]MBP9723739.1 hypothetical protein [Bacteroidia bacterium]
MRLPHYIALFFILLLWLPFVQTLTRVLPEETLHGAVTEIKQPKFTIYNWGNNVFQDEAAAWLDSKTGLRSMLIRLRNQWLKVLFDESGEKDFLIGKNGNVFSLNNIRSVTGDDFTGKENYLNRFAKLKIIHDSMARRGIPMLIVIAPGKANLYPQDLPMPYSPAEKTRTNYYWLSHTLRESGIPYVDYHHWFSLIKDTSVHLLMTKLGIHWSVYAQALVLDTLCQSLEQLKPLPHRSPVITGIRKTNIPEMGDNDTEPVLNLMIKPKYQTYSYPTINFTGTPQQKVKLLCVGDSYFQKFIHTGTADSLFAFNYWYYHNTAYSNGRKKYRLVNEEKTYWDILFDCDYLLLIHSEVTWKEPGFDFIDTVYEKLSGEK